MAITLHHAPTGTEQSLAAWGLRGPRILLINQGVDSLSIEEPGGRFDEPPLFAFDDTVTLKLDSTPVFSGRVGRPKSSARGDEIRRYEIHGPWSWLDQIAYQQLWTKVTTGILGTVVDASRRSRIVVGQDEAGDKRGTAAEITAALQWAVDNGASLQIGTIAADATIPYQELVDVTVAELVRTCLRWTPDAHAWFDYSTTPPTLHIRRRASLAPVTIALDPDLATGLEIEPREDLRVPAVAITYEQTHSEDGSTWTTTTVDKWPESATGAEPRALVATIDLAGAAASYERQTLKTEAIDPDSKSFWKKHVSAIKGHLDAELTITEAAVTDAAGDPSSLPRYVTEGAVNDWMGVSSGEVNVSCKIAYSGTAYTAFPATPFSVTLDGVDTSQETFSRLVSFTAAEPVPSGLAQILYEGYSFLHWQGSVEIEESEVTFLIHPGNTLRLAGGRLEWTEMDAMVQQVEHDLDNGITRIAFGPAEHLGPQDLVAQLRANRSARPSYRLNERATGLRSTQSISNGPQKTPTRNATTAPGGASLRFIVVTYTPAGAFPLASEIVTAIQDRYTALAFTPSEGDFLIVGSGSKSLHYIVAPTTGIATNTFRILSFTVGSTTKRAVQVGPKGFW